VQPKVKIFIAYPHSVEGERVLDEVVRPTIERVSATCVVAPHSIASPALDTVHRMIRDSDALVAIAIGRNPHVFLEVGLAHGLGKSCVLVVRSPSDLGLLADALPTVWVESDTASACVHLRQFMLRIFDAKRE
jgi:hypothetical protein